MKTLYVSDLDGTLLRSDEHTSRFTNEAIESLVSRGMIFSYATARSIYSSHVVFGTKAHFPVITYNGSMMIDNADGSLLLKNTFDDSIHALLGELIADGIYPIVYAFKDGRERFSFIEKKSSQEQREFIAQRNDERKLPVDTVSELTAGDIFYLTMIGHEDKLPRFNEKYRDVFHCIMQKDIYSGALWLEIMPKGVTKAAAVLQLKAMLGCERVIAFGDGLNDLEMFRIADECYAVSNAAPELKAAATAVIGSNNEDAVAKWLLDNYKG